MTPEEEAAANKLAADEAAKKKTEEELAAALRCFNREIQIIARNYIVTSYDTAKLKAIEREIEGFNLGAEQKEYLRTFVRAYGQKDRKRARDKLLRDMDVGDKVLEVRKKSAFLGYTYRRIRTTGCPKRHPIQMRGRGV